jgi:hypothetical protein
VLNRLLLRNTNDKISLFQLSSTNTIAANRKAVQCGKPPSLFETWSKVERTDIGWACRAASGDHWLAAPGCEIPRYTRAANVLAINAVLVWPGRLHGQPDYLCSGRRTAARKSPALWRAEFAA